MQTILITGGQASLEVTLLSICYKNIVIMKLLILIY